MAFQYVVEGTLGDDLINLSYVGDPEGDLIDANDHSDGSNDDSVLAGDGDDSIDAGTGDDTIDGGSGDDEFFLDVALQNDVLIGGETGEDSQGDRVNFSTISDDITILFTAPEAGTLSDGVSITTFSEIEEFQMGTGNDSVVGSSGAEVIIGNYGSDTIEANGGNDTIYSGFDSDLVLGGDGDDSLVTSSGADTVSGGTGADQIEVGANDGEVDTVVIADGDGDDVVSFFEGPIDNNDGTYTGQDRLDVSGLTDATGNPIDVSDVTVSDDGSGSVVLIFPNGASVKLIGIAPETFSDAAALIAIGIPDGETPTTGADNLVGTSGADSIDLLAGNDTYAAGAGDDTVLGNDGDDSLSGEGDNDQLDGGAGNDTLLGGGGDDTLTGGLGADNLSGGDGFDYVSYADATESARVDFLNPAGTARAAAGDSFNELDPGRVVDVEGVIGTAFDDFISTDLTDNAIFTGDGDDRIRARKGRDTMEAGAGNDELDAGKGRDRMNGDDGNDLLIGRRGHDNMRGGRDDDTIDGGTGKDLMLGGRGNDLLIGGEDDDTIQGNQNDDTFVFADGHGDDVITDFEATNDLERIDFSGLSTMNSFVDVEAAATQQGADLLIITGGSSSILLEGVAPGDLGAEDFIF
ncbi:calcium-binding protein [Marimonas lutisalis]|uniref:calcium-binding protein n=1 Tax=Marimonas lutisalis TaxID=2545756 RepID=UPI0010F4BB7B|nr:calcium-binding protein [Marimonas lutisalis]